MDCSLPGFSVHGIFQARVLEWVVISFSRGSSRPRDRTQVSRIVDRCFYPLSHQGSPFQRCPHPNLWSLWIGYLVQQKTRLLCPWDFPGKSTVVGCHFLLQEMFPTQGLNPGLPHCRQMLYHLSYQGYKTPHQMSQVRTHNFEWHRRAMAPLPSATIKLSFPTSPQTLSLRFCSWHWCIEAKISASNPQHRTQSRCWQFLLE